MNGYVCFFGDKSIEVYADDLFEAKKKAVKMFKVSKKKEYAVSVHLAEKAGEQTGEQIVQTADF